jgi:hypothetical protein
MINKTNVDYLMERKQGRNIFPALAMLKRDEGFFLLNIYYPGPINKEKRFDM